MQNQTLTQNRLKELFDYDPSTGIFTRKAVDGIGRRRYGEEVGHFNKTDNYVSISIDGVNHRAHRLAWLFMEGYFPEHGIDHIKGIRNDNRWGELRQASKVCNAQNTKMLITNRSGFPGVHWEKWSKKWRVQMRVNGSKKHIGRYTDKLEAALARLTAEVNCAEWTCNNRSEIVRTIKGVWPQFNERSVSL